MKKFLQKLYKRTNLFMFVFLTIEEVEKIMNLEYCNDDENQGAMKA